MQQSILYASKLVGSNYELRQINSESDAESFPLSSNILLPVNTLNNAGKIAFQIDLESVSGDADGTFVINASIAQASPINILPTDQGVVELCRFKATTLSTLMIVNVPGNSRYLSVNWLGSSTSDTAKVFVNYNF